MRTQLMIMLIVLGVFVGVVAVVVAVIWVLGWTSGLVTLFVAALALTLLFMFLVKPWYQRWGATDAEPKMSMPGDDLIADGGAVTRAIAINAEPRHIWPWMVQIGFGRAGWYSYDWIDNDGHPSADTIQAEFQDLKPGDKILMMPTMGFEVKAVDPESSIVSLLDGGTTSWSLCLYPQDDGTTRLVSRWRNKWGKITPASAMFVAITDPGTFIMEQKMLREIRKRAETLAAA